MNKPSITIAIPAHNEEHNISNLINSLLRQKIISGTLEKIIVISDGSTDNTAGRVRAINDTRVELIELPERRGKYYVQNYFATHTESDILVCLDADILPVNSDAIDRLIDPITNDNGVGLVAADSIPTEPRTFFEKVLENSHRMKKEIALNINNEDNIYLCSGLARAFRKDFYKKISWESDMPEDAFSYIKCIELGFKFTFAKDSKFTFRLPSNFKDHLRQSRRFFGGSKAIERKARIKNPYKIPPILGCLIVSKFIFKHPILTSIYILVVFYIKFWSDSSFSSDWETSLSTKISEPGNPIDNKILTVSVGIPAYNEERNIARLIRSVLNQEESNFLLKEVLIFSDGSIDGTAQKANLGDIRIKIFDDGKREGKTVRQNQMIEEMTGDILMILDADIAIQDTRYLEKMISPFYTQENVGIVGGRTVPLPPKNLFERIMNYSASFKNDIYQRINNGNNLYFCHGRNRAFSARFLENFSWPKMASEDAFSYLSCISRGFKFVSPRDVKIFYRSPQSLNDHLKQSTRFIKSKRLLVRWFDRELVDKEYRIKILYILQSAVKYIFKNPVYFALYAIILAISKIKTMFQDQPDHKWDISESSKELT